MVLLIRVIQGGRLSGNNVFSFLKGFRGLPCPPLTVLEAILEGRRWTVGSRTRSGPEGSSRSDSQLGWMSGLPPFKRIMLLKIPSKGRKGFTNG